MWKFSVEPIPSMMSTPVFSFHWCQIGASNASPAETHRRSEDRSYFSVKPSTASMAA